MIHDKELLSIIFNHSQQAVVITDRQGTILMVNLAFTEVTGYTAEEAIGRTPRILKSRRHDEQFYKSFWERLLAKGNWQGIIWNRKKNGEGYASRLRVSSAKDDKGNILYFIGTSEDITTQMLALDENSQSPNLDILTELPNRRLFRDRFTFALQQAEQYQEGVALLLLDLDDFRRINGSLGHHAADVLLRAVARRLVESLRKTDMLARLEQDEFAIGLTGIKNVADVKKIAHNLLEAISVPIVHDGTVVSLEACIGTSIFPHDGSTTDQLFQNADIAMSRAKKGGKNQCQFFDPAMTDQINRRFSLISELHKAIPGELRLLYQPQFEIASGRIIGAEALVRWQHPKKGLLGPDYFLPIAEETGSIHKIGAWVLKTACRQASRWYHAEGLPIRVAVNVSASQLHHPDFGKMVEEVLTRFNLPPAHLELELTETTVMTSIDEAATLFHKLKKLGVNIALDDFGTGYSSLACLKKLPLSCLKIDRAFFRDIPQSQDDMVLVRTILEIAHCLSLRAVAEGIENPSQLAFLKQIRCDEYQGYLLAKPLPANELLPLLQRTKKQPQPFVTFAKAAGHA